MRKGFTFIELMIVIAMVAIIAAIAIPNMMEHKVKEEAAKTIIGKVFELNGIKAMVMSYDMGKYKVVLLGPQPTQVEMDKTAVDAVYAEYLKTHLEKP